jgi:hypothetical protein
MTDIPLEDRCYWVYSPAYESTISYTASCLYNDCRAIGRMVMEIYTIKLKTLKNMN